MKRIEQDGKIVFQIEAADTMIRVAGKELTDLKGKVIDAKKAAARLDDELQARQTLFWQKIESEMLAAGAKPDDIFEYDSQAQTLTVVDFKNLPEIPDFAALLHRLLKHKS